VAARPLPLRRFRPLLYELWRAGGCRPHWPQAAAAAAWDARRGADGFPNLPFPWSEDRTWRTRLHELNHGPPPPEVDPDRLERRGEALRAVLMYPIQLDPVYAGGSSRDREREARRHEREAAALAALLAQRTAELALLRRLGPERHRRRRRRKDEMS
jgi:hypothetical protein